jgi:murein DD-endopeptidase MepM/ murein hydrolase activator NlpD
MEMKHFILIFLTIIAYCKTETLSSQNAYPKKYFRAPVDFKISLAGSFGELRKNHFHSGIDIRTEGVQGKPVYAVRISIPEWK